MRSVLKLGSYFGTVPWVAAALYSQLREPDPDRPVVRVWNVDTQDKILDITGISLDEAHCFSHKGDPLARSGNLKAQFFSTSNGKLVTEFEIDDRPTFIGFGGQGREIAVAKSKKMEDLLGVRTFQNQRR